MDLVDSQFAPTGGRDAFVMEKLADEPRRRLLPVQNGPMDGPPVGAVQMADEGPVEGTLEWLIAKWDPNTDRSAKVSAAGVLYLIRKGQTVAKLVSRDWTNTDMNLRMFRLTLQPGEVLLSVAFGARHQTQAERFPDAPIEQIAGNVSWLVEKGHVWKVRGALPQQYLPREYSNSPRVAVTTYTPHGTGLAFDLLENDQVVVRLGEHGIQLPAKPMPR